MCKPLSLLLFHPVNGYAAAIFRIEVARYLLRMIACVLGLWENAFDTLCFA